MITTRREFLKATAFAGGGLAISFHLGGCSAGPLPSYNPEDFQPNAFIQVTPDSRVILQMHKVEMGQGILTGLTTLVAEEMDMQPGNVVTQFAKPHPAYKDPEKMLQVTGGSSSMRSSYIPIREAAATVREMLSTAAAQYWQVSVNDISIIECEAINNGNGERLPIGDLIDRAKALPIPDEPCLKPEEKFKYIGRYDSRVDALDKVNGKAQFAIDLDIPEALTAVIARCPHFGGRLKSFNDEQARQQNGVKAIFAMENGIAVVATSYWRARKAADQLQIEWKVGDGQNVSSQIILAEHQRLLALAQGKEIIREGKFESAKIVKTLQAVYHVPYLAHATMEPLNAIVSVTPERVTVWAGNQAPGVARSLVAEVLNRRRKEVEVHTTLLGGGFGRRFVPDYIVEAAVISQRVEAPVRLIWSREDDIQHDYYRPGMSSLFKAEFTSDGQLYQWYNHVVGASITAQLLPVFGAAMLPEWVPPSIPNSLSGLAARKDYASVEGADNIPYQFLNRHLDYTAWDPGIPVGYWRSVGHSQNGFFVESFFDEVAHFLNRDPLELRRQLLINNPRYLTVLNGVAKMANWGKPAAGRFHGVAVHESYDNVVAQVAEVSVQEEKIIVHKIYCVTDCGRVINPDIVVTQIESAIIFGLTAALKGEITFHESAVQQSNFHDYQLLRINETPEIEVQFIKSELPPLGVGEPGVPPVAPAVANAVFAATGKRLRTLPLKFS